MLLEESSCDRPVQPSAQRRLSSVDFFFNISNKGDLTSSGKRDLVPDQFQSVEKKSSDV